MKQKLHYVVFVACFYFVIDSNAQTDSINYKQDTNAAIAYLQKENYSQQDSIKAIELLKPCVDGEYPHAQFIMGRLYLNNHLQNDDEKGFKLIKKSAKQYFPRACTDLGNLFKYGIGCEIDFKKAKKWYKKAHKLGDTRGTYSVGYLHYKGLGIKQNYKKAIKWFKQSNNYPMAKHWLGVAHYFGYGVSVNKQKAMKLLKENYIENSDVMLHCMEYHLNNNEENKTDIEFTEILDSELKSNNLSFENLKGNWSGSLVQLDWSEKHVEQSFPVSVEFSKDPNEQVVYKLSLIDQSYEGVAESFDNKLLFEDFSYNFKRPYFNSNDEQNVSYTINSASFEISTFEDQEYLTAIFDTYVASMREPGNTLALILSKDETVTENGKTISSEVVDALSEQTDDFIKLYPNPFESDLFISYKLEDSGLVHITVSDLNGNQSYALEEGRMQSSGSYTYYFDGSILPQGISVITVFVNGEKHTKLIAKK
ncbi:SEL1-like repeat protein [Jejuia pallidilutea]|uniref:Secretion system C-terminal sorting domain-containing protein n=1 Tax=Jejuia pallidilutea TaxID=504487 RepID=A0A090WJT3_9FLAO|nr:SEL1-like repeat protein [Jejuia pallidilutea]GAL67722.1 hypothetical protein JCM19301_1009 [Jejuia pallidilutea]GAL71982.1 hypothetical protein JCM19302_327 [Jejuia pallidilutea]GAL88325.1 hypothetical protein JCM19538_1651 [Jejuia pallidilutea]